MQSDVRTSNHLRKEVNGFKGLYTSLLDLRLIAEGMLMQASDVVYDQAGVIRPKDGSQQWWAPLSQRVYVGEMEVSEDAQWSGGAADTTHVLAGYQARTIAASGTTTATRTFVGAIDGTLSGDQALATGKLNIGVWSTTPTDVTAATLTLASSGGSVTFNIATALAALTAGQWGYITVAMATPSSSTGTFDLSAMITAAISVTCTAGAALWFDEYFLTFTDVSKSFCTGGIEFRRISDDSRYTVAGFGDTVYADLNEAQLPYKILSGVLRNAPLSMGIAEDRLAIFDSSANPGWIFTGDLVRPIGFPAPVSWSSPFAANGSGGGLTPSSLYYYGVTFTYGAGDSPHGQSSAYEVSTAVTLGSTDGTVNLQNLPVGGLGSGVIQRRVWRSLANAGPYASKYLVAVIADNTTTTYQDTLSDSALILGEQEPIDNGLPPAACLQGVWFQKGMIYVTPKAVYYSRPGVDLNSSFEIVPGTNIITLGQAGRVVGGIEFNNQFYLFSRTGVGKLRWQGSVLLYEPVQRSSEDRSQNIGCAHLRSLTLINNRYIRFIDAQGQVWKMLSDEEFFHESRPVENLTANFNPLQADFNLSYKYYGDTLGWNTGTLGANLSSTEQPGVLAYARSSLTQQTYGASAPPGQITAGTFTPLDDAAGALHFSCDNSGGGATSPAPTGLPQSGTVTGGGLRTGPQTFRLILTAQALVRLEQLYLPYKQVLSGGRFPNPQIWTATIYKPHYETSTITKGLQLYQTSGTIAGTVNAGELNLSPTTPLFIPAGESIIVEIVGLVFWDEFTVSSGQATWHEGIQLFSAKSAFTQSSVGTSGLTQAPSDSLSNFSKSSAGYADVVTMTSASYALMYITTTEVSGKTVIENTGVAADTKMQRIHAVTCDPANFGLRTASAFSASVLPVDVSTTPFTDFPGGLQDAWDVTAVAWPIGQSDPTFTQTTQFPQPSDYRPSAIAEQFYAASLQFQWTFGAAMPPLTEAAARVTLTQNDVVPYITYPYTLYAVEASFPSPYDKANYAGDTWTSAAITTGTLANLGALTANYTVNQQDVFFQIRGADTALDLSTATWYDVAPGAIPNIGSLATINYIQLRVIFQDRPGIYLGTPSVVKDLQLGWAATANKLAPAQAPVLFYYRDYSFLSWPGRTSRVLDNSAALSDYQGEGYGADFAEGMWSTFSPPHYACYFIVGSKLVGGQSAGGRLNWLRNSSPIEADGRTITASIITHPMMLGTAYIKTLHWMYLGLQLNIHAYGYLAALAAYWPTPSDAGNIYGRILYAVRAALTPPLQGLGGYQTVVGPGTSATYGAAIGQGVLAQELPFQPYESFLISAPQSRPMSPEYGFDMGLQERSFQVQMEWAPFLGADGLVYFPAFTGMGFEYFQENIRGV